MADFQNSKDVKRVVKEMTAAPKAKKQAQAKKPAQAKPTKAKKPIATKGGAKK